MQVDTRKRIANLTSNILSPFSVSLVVILLLSLASTSSILDTLKWSLILMALGILPVFLFMAYLVRIGRLDGIFTNIRQQRTKIYLLAGICTGVGCILLPHLGAPSILLAAFAAGFAAVVIFMCINFWWKISLHTAFITALITLSVIVYGFKAMVSVVLIPLIAWARVESGHHSLAQVATAVPLAASIMVVVYYLFGLI